MSNDVALRQFMQPLTAVLAEDGVTDICFNGDIDFCFVEKNGIWEKRSIEGISSPYITYFKTFSTLVASLNNQTFDKNNPILSGNLPGLERVQLVRPPCANYVVDIRNPTKNQFSLEDYKESGSFDNTRLFNDDFVSDEEVKLNNFYNSKDFYNFLILAVKLKKNIIISGGTGSGKTTFFNTLLRLVPDNERIICIEDSREACLEQENKVFLISPSNSNVIGFEDLLKACLRLKPDRIMATEIRGREAFSFLRAINTGHPGSMTTVHANDTLSAFEQINLMLSQANVGMDSVAIDRYIKGVVDIVVQIKPVNGIRTISEVYFKSLN